MWRNKYLDGKCYSCYSASHRVLSRIDRCLSTTANNRSPGLDGLPAETYKQYSESLLPTLLATLNGAVQRGALPASMGKAIIVVLPNLGKDPLLLDSFRPISLINTDIKLLTTVLATRLTKVMPGLIHLDQSGFIPARSMALNIRRLFLNLQLPVDNPGNRAVYSLDAAKAFDSVEWRYLWAVLCKFRVGKSFLA